jgi:hypothetical protein
MQPHPNSPCSGKFGVCLDVLLTSKCNGGCKFCIEKGGYHPQETASPESLAKTINDHPAKTILLLGGEPTLYPHLNELLGMIRGKETFLTTNGSKLTPDFVRGLTNASKLFGINLSRHHFDSLKNSEIIGTSMPSDEDIFRAIRMLPVPVRLNCNLVRGGIDSNNAVRKLLQWSQDVGVFRKVRLSELSGNPDLWVSARSIMEGLSLLHDDPWGCGCESEFTYGGVPVTVRRICQYVEGIPEEEAKHLRKTVLHCDCHQSPVRSHCEPSERPATREDPCHPSRKNQCSQLANVLYPNGQLSVGWRKAV